MGGVGSDIAVDAADIVLVDDEVKELPHLIALSRRMMTTIKVNMTFSMGLNFLAIVLAIIGTLNLLWELWCIMQVSTCYRKFSFAVKMEEKRYRKQADAY